MVSKNNIICLSHPNLLLQAHSWTHCTGTEAIDLRIGGVVSGGPQGEQGPRGEQGLTGDTGEQGPDGNPGTDGIAGIHVHTANSGSVNTTTSPKTVAVECNNQTDQHTGEIAIAGGGSGIPGSTVALSESIPVGGDGTTAPTGWTSSSYKTTSNPSWTHTTYVLCVPDPDAM